MMKTLTGINLSLFAMLICLLFVSYTGREEREMPEAPTPKQDALPQIIQSVDMDKEFSFAGEKVPLDIPDVRERLEKELTVNSYYHSSTVMHMKLAARYFPGIEKILQEEGVPTDFKYLAVAESALENAVSPAGARGMWQFMGRTGQAYGLEINSEVDERYHFEKSTRAAARYLKDYYENFGSWTLAAAAYNMGGPSLEKELERQKEDSYYDLNLSQETNRYVFRILAMKEIHSHPEEYGFYLEDEEKYEPMEPFYEVEVNETVESLADFAHEHGISYRILKAYNPWMLSFRLTNNSGKTYLIRVPGNLRD